MARIAILIVILFGAEQLYAENMPPHAHKNIYGTGWECDRGYYRSGQQCTKVVVPEHAHINVYGNGWECDRGYYRTGQECRKEYRPNPCVNSLAIKIIRAYPPNNKVKQKPEQMLRYL